ncbi:RidA family protein [Candidatus Latescibacterota bacterium]
MECREVRTDQAPASVGPYSQAIVAGGMVYCAGQIALDPATSGMVVGDIADETRRVMENLGAVLEAAGSSFDRVVKTTIYLRDMAVFPRVNEVYGSYFGACPPARATVQVSALPKGAGVEIDCIALAGGGGDDGT